MRRRALLALLAFAPAASWAGRMAKGRGWRSALQTEDSDPIETEDGVVIEPD